jgi:ubiquinone/menaquinone biosynthesis C-methylase UbiE
MPAIDVLFSIRGLRKALWKFWYPFLTRRTGDRGVLFLNYAYEEEPPLGLPLAPADEPDRGCIQLYHHVASQADLSGKEVLEVGCGHGGGASFVKRTLRPRRMTGLDLNPDGIALCRSRHAVEGLDFKEGDAEALPFPDASFDAVLNVESSHCYPDFPRFLSEVARVLKPGGVFLYADFRFRDGLAAWEAALAGAPLAAAKVRDITPHVLRGMDMNSDRSQTLIVRLLPRFMHNLARDFAGVRGSRIYKAMKEGEVVYRSFLFEKPRPAGA